MADAPPSHARRLADAGDQHVLLLSPVDPDGPPGGREMLSRTNLALLRELLGDTLSLIRPARATSPYRDAWRGYVDGVDAAFITDLLSAIDERGITQLFVDGSNFGAAVGAVKQARPKVRIVTFCHNVETRFFWGALKMRRSVKALGVLVANYVAERRASRASDVLVTLSERDSAGFKRLFGRRADVIAPIVLQDRAPPARPAPAIAGRYLLFVGGGFYANIAGIRWFAQTVAPRIDLPVKVVGRDMEALAETFAGHDHVELIGAVDDLASWYAGAALVVAPIFDGSGMKTKVAEALMHGKHIAGTPEAFSGYAADVIAANRCCADADAFVAAIRELEARPRPGWDAGMRALYDRDHSPAAARVRMAALLRPA